jgi:glycosyltransferase involved in cell wall biosynthesis
VGGTVRSDQPSLSVVIPVFNQAEAIGQTLHALEEALSRTGFASDVVVVDDGSTDGTAEAVRVAPFRFPLVIVEQQNRGRFEARQRGLEQAAGQYCLLLDSRAVLDPDSLRFVEAQLRGEEAAEVWNGHVEIAPGGGPFAVFWDVITRRVFAAYFAAPRTTSYGLVDFERFPKGTTCFFAPRALLTEAFAAFRSGYADQRHANDDTPVIRWIAGRRPINISPQFACRYAARTRLGPFVGHAFHRGVVFVDGHGRPESAWFPAVLALYAGSAGCLVLARRSHSVIPAALAVIAATGAGLALVERRPRDALTMAWLTPVYATAHVAGMWRGLGMLLRTRIAPRP